MKNHFSIFVGVAVLALTVGLNVRHALNDYGVKTNKLHLEVLAQTSTTGGGSTSGGGSSTSGGVEEKYTCEDTITTENGQNTFFCGSCEFVKNSKPATFSATKTCTK